MLSALSFWACKTALQNGPVVIPQGFDWQGHRGCRGLLPENTLPAFLHAVEIPEVVTLELDLAVSKDKQLIVSHEPWFNPAICRQPNGDSISAGQAEKFLIYEMTAAEIRSWDCGSQGNSRFPQQEKIKAYKPTLREVIFAVRKAHQERPIRWNIEIKSQPDWDGIRHPAVEEFARLVVEELKYLHIENVCTVQSFDVRALQAVKKLNPALRLALLVENVNGLGANLKALGFTPDIYSPYYLLVDKKLVRKCHEQHIQVIPWTVNDVASMKQLLRLGVDGIITDYPNLIVEVGKT